MPLDPAAGRFVDGRACTLIGERLHELAGRQPDAPALQAPGRRSATFADIDAQVATLGARLASFGIGPGDVVAGVAGSRVDMAGACLAIPACATFVPLSATLATATYGALLDRLHPRAVVVPRDGLPALEAAATARRIPRLALGGRDEAPAGIVDIELRDTLIERGGGVRVDPAIACVMVTSGTTGDPKLVPCRHEQLLQRSRTIAGWLGYAPGDLGCHVVPLHLGHGLRAALLDPVLAGAAVRVLPVGDVGALLEAIDSREPTFASAGFTVA